MDVLQIPRSEIKGDGAAPPSRHHNPAAVVSFPTALTPEQRRQQVMWRRHAGALSAFLKGPTHENEKRARDTGKRWIAAYLGNGEDAQRALRSLDERLFKTRFPLLVTGLHALGPLSTSELLLEIIGGDERLRDDVFALLERYTRLTPAEVQGVGADVYPEAPLYAVPAP